MKMLIGCVACFVAGSALGLVGVSLDGGADVSQASLLPVTITPHVEPIIVTKTLPRQTSVQYQPVAQAPLPARVETVVITETQTTTVTADPTTTTVTETKAKERGRG